jgi:uncharacterized protein GlcG (DUF336 family)
MSRRPVSALVSIASLLLASCGGGGGGGSGSSAPPPPATPTSVYAVPGAESLSVADVQMVLAQSIAEAQARTLPAVIAVTDRVGNVLAVYSMTGARANATLRPGTSGNTDAQGLVVPAPAAAIAKAMTGGYLSSDGNAFSTRTASMIVQQHFPPSASTAGLESGPLFGVQFSSLPCSDLMRRYTGTANPDAFIGPKRSPLGLAADPGGFPLYKNGVLVGAVGVMADGDYGFDPEVAVVDSDPEEAIALAGTVGFDAPITVRAERIAIDGTTLRYSDAGTGDLRVNPASATAFTSLGGGVGALIPITGFFGGTILSGQVYGTEPSGVRKATTAEFNNPDAFLLTDGSGAPRYPVQAGADAAEVGTPLSAAEVRGLMEEAFKVMAHTRAGIRQPLDSRAQVTISVVDTRGSILGIVQSPDATLFGVDVSLQKARTASFMSGSFTAADLTNNLDPVPATKADIANFVPVTRTFLGDVTALTGHIAFSLRGIGNLARPYFPDGQVGQPNGPLSRPIAHWSPFSTGLQSALILSNLTGPDRTRCTYLPDVAPGQNRLQNGLQIFAGGVPIYRGTTLIGAIGVSGDGIDQDDMISFLGLSNAATRLGSIKQADPAIRSDQVIVGGVRLRYVNCPVAPFVDTTQQNVCTGL